MCRKCLLDEKIHVNFMSSLHFLEFLLYVTKKDKSEVERSKISYVLTHDIVLELLIFLHVQI